MSLHPIDELFKKRFSNREEKTPEHLWPGIEDALHGKRKTRPIAPLWLKWSALGAFLLLGVSIVSYQYFWGMDESTPIHSSVVLDEDQPTSISSKGEGKDYNTTISSTGESASKQEILQSNIESPDTRSQDLRNSDKKISSELKNQNSGFEFEMENSSGRKKTTKENIQSNKQKSTPISGITEKGKTSNNLMNQVLASEEEKNRVASETLKRERLAVLEALVSGRDYITKGLQSEEDRSYRSIDRVNTEIGYGRRTIRLKWIGQLGYGYDFVQREMTARTNAGRAMTNYRNSHESLANAFTVSLELGIKWHSWSILSGVHYAQINDRYDYLLEEVTRDVSGALVTGTVSRSVVNRYRSIEVPIMVQYEWTKDQWSFGAIAGISLGIDYQMTGQLLNNESLDIIDFDSQENGPYVDRVAYQPILAVQVGYKLGYRSMLFLRPMYKYNPNTLTIDSYEVDHRQSVLSGLLGVRYNIN